MGANAAMTAEVSVDASSVKDLSCPGHLHRGGVKLIQTGLVSPKGLQVIKIKAARFASTEHLAGALLSISTEDRVYVVVSYI